MPQIWIYNKIMEIKNKSGNWVKIEKGDVIGDESEEGIVVCILVEDGEIEFGVSDMKEGWSLKLNDVKIVNGDKVELA